MSALFNDVNSSVGKVVNEQIRESENMSKALSLLDNAIYVLMRVFHHYFARF